jgi:hypothetical protein
MESLQRQMHPHAIRNSIAGISVGLPPGLGTAFRAIRIGKSGAALWLGLQQLSSEVLFLR